MLLKDDYFRLWAAYRSVHCGFNRWKDDRKSCCIRVSPTKV